MRECLWLLAVAVAFGCEQRALERETGGPNAARPRVSARYAGLESDYPPNSAIAPAMVVTNDGDVPAFIGVTGSELVDAGPPNWKEVLEPESPAQYVDPEAPIELAPGESAVAHIPGFEVPEGGPTMKCAVAGFAEVVDQQGNVIDAISVISDPFLVGGN